MNADLFNSDPRPGSTRTTTAKTTATMKASWKTGYGQWQNDSRLGGIRPSAAGFVPRSQFLNQSKKD